MLEYTLVPPLITLRYTNHTLSNISILINAFVHCALAWILLAIRYRMDISMLALTLAVLMVSGH